MVSFLVNGILAVLLVVATVFLVLVNKRLKVLRSGQEELNGLMATFSTTIDETDASTKRLVGAATEISLKLAEELDRAKSVTEDVGVLLDSCDRAAKRLEESVFVARSLVRRLDEAPRSRAPEPPPPSSPPPVNDGPSVNASTLASRLAALVGDDLIGPAEDEDGADDGFQPIKPREAETIKKDAAKAEAAEADTPIATAEPRDAAPVVERSSGTVGAFYRHLRTLETTGR